MRRGPRCAPRRERLLQLVVGGVRLREPQVGADRVVEEVRVLRHEPDRGVQRFEREVAHVVPVDAHRALDGFVDARHEHRDRGLARARRSDERDGVAGFDDQREVAQDPLARFVAAGRTRRFQRLQRHVAARRMAEPHVVELDATARARRARRRPGRSAIAAGKSSTSKTRSNDTSAVRTSTREFVSCASGW